jgi:hypothetical protein
MTEILRVMPSSFAGFSREDAEKELARLEAERKRQADALNEQSPVPKQPNNNFGIEKIAEGEYLMRGLYYREHCWQLKFTTFCLENNARKQFKDWMVYSLEKESKNAFYSPSLALEFAIWKELYCQNDNRGFKEVVLSARNELQRTLLDEIVMMLSEIQYNSPVANDGEDLVMHVDIGLLPAGHNRTYGKSAKIKGTNEENFSKEACYSFFSDNRKDVVNEVISWITRRNPCVMCCGDIKVSENAPITFFTPQSSSRCYINAGAKMDAGTLGVSVIDYQSIPQGGAQ